MSSENHPVRRAWVRHARSKLLRKWLLAGLAVVLAVTAGERLWHRRAPQAPPVAASTQPAGVAEAPALREALTGQEALILALPNLNLAPSPAPAQIALPPGAAAAPNAPAAPELPTVEVAPRHFHVVPEESATHSMGPVILSDRNGRTLRVVPPSALAAPLVSSVNPPPRPPRAASPVVANPPVFSGRARAAGALALDFQGQTVRLFGVRPADPQDRCGGAAREHSCDAAAAAALKQKLASHPIVACRVPPGQQGAPGAICLDEEGTDLGRYLVIQGLALADTSQSYDYLPAEAAARSAKRGLWKDR